MGNNDSQPQNLQILKRQNWIQAGQDQQKILFSNVNPYRKRLLANIVTQQLIEEYELNFIAQEDYNNYVKQLNFRKEDNKKIDKQDERKHINTDTNKYIYPIRYFVNKSKTQLCTTVYTGLLYIEKVDLRLKQINDIPFDDLIYIYKATLEGFKYLYQKVGYFDIQQQMIFINRKGQLKVWMNSNLSKNYPNFQKAESITNKSKQGSQCVYGSQSQMIKDLIQLIQKNSDQNQPSHPPLFSEYLSQRNLLQRLSFDYCLQQFHNYLDQYNIFIFAHMRSITQLFNPDQINITARTNYQQSHVNQITTAHINQLKKRFQPMQTIIQNDNFTTVSNHNQKKYSTIQQNKNQRNFHTSSVSNYSNKKFQKSQNYLSQNHLRGVIRPTFNNKDFQNNHLNNYHRNNFKNHEQYLTRPTYFPNNSHFSNDGIQSNPIFIHQNNKFKNTNFNRNSLPVPVNMNINNFQKVNYNNNFVEAQKNGVKIIPLINTQTRKVVFNSPQQIYRLRENNIILQNCNMNKLPVNNYTLQNQVIQPKIAPILQQRLTKATIIPQFHQNINLNTRFSQNSQNYFKQQAQFPKQIKQAKTTIIQTSNNKNNSVKKQQKPSKLTKSNIKYHSIKQSYQLDQQIAYDLQKFLGLKVN